MTFINSVDGAGEVGERYFHPESENRVCILLGLRLQAVNWSVGEVVQRCRDVVLSRHLVHHSAFAGRAKPGDKLRLHTITVAFAEAFHEIRSWPPGSMPSRASMRRRCWGTNLLT